MCKTDSMPNTAQIWLIKVEIVNYYVAICLASHKCERNQMQRNFCQYTGVSIFKLWSFHLTLTRNFYRITEGGGQSWRCLDQTPCSKQGQIKQVVLFGALCNRSNLQYFSGHQNTTHQPFCTKVLHILRIRTNKCMFYLTALAFNCIYWPETVKLSEHVTSL